MAVVNEITGLKLTKKRAQYLASFPELNPDPIVEVASSGDVTFHNGAAQKVLEDQGMNGEDFSPFLPPDLHVMIQELSQGRAVSLYREVTIKERVFGEAIHLVPQLKTVRIYAHDVTNRKRAEEALRASRLQLSEAMDLAHIVYWDADPVTRTFIFNDPFYAFYGTTAEQEGGYLMTREDYGQRFIHPDDLPLYYQFGEETALRPGPEFVADLEHRIVRRDGEVRHILARTRILKDDSGRIMKIYGANQDITERKQAEEALRDSETTLRSLVNATKESLLLIDPGGKILVANRTIAQRLGRSARELIGASIYEYFPPEVAARRKAEYDKVVRTGQPVHFFDERAGRAHETYGYPVFDNEGRVTRVAIFAADITERKQAEEMLQESERKYRELVEHANSIILRRDISGRVTFFNEYASRFLGFAQDEIIGRNVVGTSCPPPTVRARTWRR